MALKLTDGHNGLIPKLTKKQKKIFKDASAFAQELLDEIEEVDEDLIARLGMLTNDVDEILGAIG